MQIDIKEWGNHYQIWVDGILKFMLMQIGNRIYLLNESNTYTLVKSKEEGIGSIIAASVSVSGEIRVRMLE